MKMNKEKPQKQRFGMKDLESLVGKELYVMVFRDYNIGSVGEMIHRIGWPAMSFWHFGNLSNIQYENGSPVNKDLKQSSEHYFFRLDNVEKPKGKPPILRGELVK